MTIRRTNIQKIKKGKENNSQKINKIKDNTKDPQIRKGDNLLKIVVNSHHRNRKKNIVAKRKQNKVNKKKNKKKDRNLNLDHQNRENNKASIEKHKIHKRKIQDLRIVNKRTKQMNKANIHRTNKIIGKTNKNSQANNSSSLQNQSKNPKTTSPLHLPKRKKSLLLKRMNLKLRNRSNSKNP